MKALLTRLVREEKGQDVIEYALLAAAISVVAIPTVPSIGSQVNNVYSTSTARSAASRARPSFLTDVPGGAGDVCWVCHDCSSRQIAFGPKTGRT